MRSVRLAVSRCALSILILVAIATVIAPVTAGALTAFNPKQTLASGTPLTTTTLGAFTEIENVDMMNRNVGVAIAGGTAPGVNRFYLVRTVDGGAHWSTVAPLPMKAFPGTGFFTVPRLQFVSRNVGYVQPDQGSIYFTTNGGDSWSRLHVSGRWPIFAITGSTVTVTSEVCKGTVPSYGPLKCPSDIERYRLVSTTPISSFVVPQRGATQYRAVVTLGALSPKADVVVEGGGEGSRSSILETRDAGATWTLLADPCQGLSVEQLLAPDELTWLLYCYMGGGMNQGISEVWHSSDHGGSWKIVARSDEGDDNEIGNIGDVANDLLFSGNKQIIFGLVDGGAAGGVEVSTNGGSKWSPTGVHGFDGAPATASTFGPSGAVVTVQGGPTYLTSNGQTWSKLPSLPVGHNPVSSECTGENDVIATPGKWGVAAGTSYVTIVLTNKGSPACWLHGIPEVQPVAGGDDGPVGPVATRLHVAGRGGRTMLGVSGGVASITVGIETAANWQPTSTCVPKMMNRLRIQFTETSFYVNIGVQQVCTKISSVNNAGVVAGEVGGP